MKSPTELSQVKTLQTLALKRLITSLFRACQMGGQENNDYVKKALDHLYLVSNSNKDMLHIALEMPDLYEDTLLIIACRTGNTDLVRYLLLRCGEHISVMIGQDSENILEKNVDSNGYTNKARLARMINYVNRDGGTALTLACLKGYVAITELLLGALFDTDKREALNHEYKYGLNALMFASGCDDAEMVKVILDAYPTYNDRLSALNHNNIHRDTALMNASKFGHAEAIKVILESYADGDRLSALNHMNKIGNTALMYASMRGRSERVKVILGAYADDDQFSALNHENKDGETALLCASRCRRSEAIKVILESYADGDRLSALNHENKVGDTALMIASRWSCYETVKVILEAYADRDRISALNHRNKEGDTALIIAAREVRSEKVKVILESCPASDRLIALQQICKAGRTALFYAVSLGNADVVTVLLSALPSADQVQAISHIDYDGSKSITALCVKNYSYTGVYRTKFEATIKALFMPLSYSERLSILGYTESDGYTTLTPITKLSKNFVMEQLEREAQQQYHSSLVPLSIFSRSVSLRLQSYDYTCRIS